MKRLRAGLACLLLLGITNPSWADHWHGNVGISIGVPLGYPWYYPPTYYPPAYYPPAYYPPVVAAPASPPVYIERDASQAESPGSQGVYWYYCPDPQGYYPYVRDCPPGWTQVVPTPPPGR